MKTKKYYRIYLPSKKNVSRFFSLFASIQKWLLFQRKDIFLRYINLITRLKAHNVVNCGVFFYVDKLLRILGFL